MTVDYTTRHDDNLQYIIILLPEYIMIILDRQFESVGIPTHSDITAHLYYVAVVEICFTLLLYTIAALILSTYLYYRHNNMTEVSNGSEKTSVKMKGPENTFIDQYKKLIIIRIADTHLGFSLDVTLLKINK